MTLYGVHAKEPFKKMGDTGIFHLTRLYLNNVVRKSEQPKARSVQFG
jgi:hypothetical protein